LKKCDGSVTPWVAAATTPKIAVCVKRILLLFWKPKQVGDAVQDNDGNGWMREKQSRQTRSEEFHQFLGIANPAY
jgi:hypothetical protein